MSDYLHKVDSILDEFDFDKVRTVMKTLNWTYFDSTEVPTVSRIYRMARNLLIAAYTADPSPEWYTASGGFEVTRYMYPGDTKKYVTLKFVVTERSKPID
jgi:hypothetical protein